MIRMIFGYKLEDKINMTRLRTNIQMFSVNQMCCYQTLTEAFNIVNHGSSDIIHKKWITQEERNYPVRRDRMGEVKVHVPNHVKCRGFTWYGAKMWNWIPVDIREIKNPAGFKVAVKRHIWENIPSY